MWTSSCLVFHQYESAQLYIEVILYTDDSPRLTYQIVSVVECDWWRSNFSPWWCVWGVCCSYSSQLDTQIDGRKVAPWVHAGLSWFRVMATTTRWSPQAFSINLWFVERVMLLWFYFMYVSFEKTLKWKKDYIWFTFVFDLRLIIRIR